MEVDVDEVADLGTPVLERLRAAVRDRRPIVSAHARAGVLLDSVEAGYCAAQMRNGPLFRAADGRLDLAALLVLIDAAASVPVTSALPVDRRSVTLHLCVSTISTRLPGAGPLRAEGRLRSLTPQSGLTSGTVVDSAGSTIARISARCAVLAGPSRLVPVGGSWPRITVAAGMADALGITVQRADGAGAELTARAMPDLANADGVVQGGALGAFAECALSRTITAVTPALAAADAHDLELVFVRGVRADGRPISCRVDVQHAGHRLVSARAEVTDQTGRLALVATAHRYGPGR